MRFFEKKRANADVNETPSKNPNPFSRAEGSRAGHFGRARIIRESHAHLQAALEAAQVLYSIIPSPSPPHRTDPRAATLRRRGGVWILVSAPSGNNHVGEGGISPCLPSSLVLARMTYRIFHPRYDPSQARRQRGAPGDRAAADHAAGSRRGWQQPRRRGLRRCWGASAAAGQAAGQASPPRPDGP